MTLRNLVLGLLVSLGAAVCSTPAVQAAECKTVDLDSKSLAAWTDPVPDAADAILFPLPGKWKGQSFEWPLVFTAISYVERGLFPSRGATFAMGADYPEPFETRIKVRASSALQPENLTPRLVLGRYELSFAQYALIMGSGDLEAGLQHLMQQSGDPGLMPVRHYFDPADPCQGKLSVPLNSFLRLPVSFLTLEELHQTITQLNRLCGRTPACRARLAEATGTIGGAAFFRLPAEHEWEFAARGAYSFGKGELTAADLQLPLPSVEGGKKMQAYAHFDNDPPRLLPIGAKKRLHGFHDMFGNAQELMSNPFSSETGSGAIGGALARGGSFRTPAKDLRVSTRTELTPYLRDEKSGRYYAQYLPQTGLRIALGLPLLQAFQLDDLQREFARSYTSVEDAGDSAGETEETARDLGVLPGGAVTIKDELDAGDAADVYGFSFDSYGGIRVSGKAGEPLLATVTDAAGTEIHRFSLRGGAEDNHAVDGLYPGRKYFLKLVPPMADQGLVIYEFALKHEPAEDTGVQRATPETLQYASVVGRSVVEHVGFVGIGDAKDIYPLRMESAAGGVSLEIGKVATALRISFRQEGGGKTREDIVEAGETGATLLYPFTKAAVAFLEIETVQRNGSTAYSAKLSPAAIYDADFATDPAAARPGHPDKEYLGNLGGSIAALYMPIELSTPASLQAALSGLLDDADLTILNASNTPLPNQHTRGGTRDEVFKRVLPKGRYIARLSVKNPGAISTPFRFSFGVEARSLQDLDPRELAISESVLLEGSASSYNLKVPAGRMARHARYKVVGEGLILFKLSFPAGKKLRLTVENEAGEQLGSSASADVSNSVYVKLAANSTYGLYIERKHASLDEVDYMLEIIPVPGEVPSILSTLMGNVQLHGIEKEWIVYTGGDHCGVASPAVRTEGAVGRPVIYLELLKGTDQFYHGVQGITGSFTGYKVFQIVKGKTKPLGNDEIATRPVSFLLTKCPQSIDGCFAPKIAKSVTQADFVKFVSGSREMEFTMKGYKAAVDAAGKICNTSGAFLVKQ
jgi:hypothetical protein